MTTGDAPSPTTKKSKLEKKSTQNLPQMKGLPTPKLSTTSAAQGNKILDNPIKTKVFRK